MTTTTNPLPPGTRAESARPVGFAPLYDALRAVARARLAGEPAEQTHAATSLVHEAWLRLRGLDPTRLDRDAFLRVAAAVMRRILVDGARRRARARRSQREARARAAPSDREAVRERLGAALDRLGQCDAQLLAVVELRFLLGLDVVATARALDVSPATVKRDWRTARAYLQRELDRDD